MQNSTNKSLFDLLVTRNFEVELLSIDGKPVADPEDARIFSFEFMTPNKNYGTVVVLLSTEQVCKCSLVIMLVEPWKRMTSKLGISF